MKPAPGMKQTDAQPHLEGLRKLIFFVSIGLEQPQYATRAFRFALAAHLEGLPAEVRLAGEAVLLAREGALASVGYPSLKEHLVAVLDEPEILVSVCPVSASRYDLQAEQVVHPKLFFKPLAQVLRELSEGRAELIYLG